MPPTRSGVAACSAELVARLRERWEIDAFVGTDVPRLDGVRSAHDFVWLNRQRPYDLVVHQLGNSRHHEFQWPYLVRYPGLLVLHDGHLHHARAAGLLRAGRDGDYRREFAWNHPEASPDLAELAVSGFDTHLHYLWPMIRLVVRRSRLVAVHAPALARMIHEQIPEAAVEAIHLGHGRIQPAELCRLAREHVRARHGIAGDAIVFGCFGGLSPEKRVPQILGAFGATLAHEPRAHLLLAGAAVPHYDVVTDVQQRGLGPRVTVTGYLETDEDLDAHIAACDVALNLRWPTAREISGPWLRSMAAAKPTIIISLRHLVDVPALDPRTWQAHAAAGERRSTDAAGIQPVAVALDILDEEHSLRLAMRRLARDADLRDSLGRAAQAYWKEHHSGERMLEDYLRVVPAAMSRPVPHVDLPPHLIDAGQRRLELILERFGLPSPLR
ncbi:MAG TPA: glycosyltransferase [Vicinamibacterales bacterium]|nr:glycosyltransferase [Vicinamibacterales bacterium]